MYYDKRFEPQVETKPDPVAAILQKAADMIDRRGWCQGMGMDGMGRVCAVRAIGTVAGDNVVFASDALRRLEDHLNIRFVSLWNDVKGRTKDEVVAALRAAAR